MFKKIKKMSHKIERGQSMVELALSFTILMLIMAGTVDLGRAFFAYIAISDAAQEGAVYGAINPSDTTGIYDRVHDASTNPIDLEDVTVLAVANPAPCASVTPGADGVWDTGDDTENTITVTVAYDFTFVMPFISTVFPNSTITLWATAENTILTPDC